MVFFLISFLLSLHASIMEQIIALQCDKKVSDCSLRRGKGEKKFIDPQRFLLDSEAS